MTTEHDILGRPPVRKIPGDNEDADLLPIEQLAAPLSAKVMPRSSLYGAGGRIMDETRALDAQRRTKYRPRQVRKVTK